MAKVLDHRDGVEVSIETGIGWVTKLDPPKGRNARVEIKAEHLNIPVTGWLDTANADLHAAASRAAESGMRIAYTIVVHRKATQPADVPLDEIPNTQRVRDLEAIVSATGSSPEAPATSSTPAATPPAERPPETSDPAPQQDTAPAAAGGAPSCGLCHGSLAEGGPVRRVAGVLQHVNCPGTGPATTAEEVAGPTSAGGTAGQEPPESAGAVVPPDASPPPAGATRLPAPRVMEGKPWEFYNTDGSLNPGSYAFQAAEGIVLLAQEQLLERARRAEGQFVPPTLGQIKTLAGLLLAAADRVQAAIRDDGHIARMSSSHSRARSAIRASLATWPVPFGATPEERAEWVDQLVDHATGILRLTIGLIDPPAAT